MFNSVRYVREICRQRGIPVSQLEKECGFSNGYLNPKKMQKLPYDRAVLIAGVLGVYVGSILTGRQDDAPDILDEVDVAFYGDFKELDEEQKEAVRDMVRLMRERRAAKQRE